jgi:hypothetical protein
MRSADEKVRAMHVLGRLTLYLLRSSVGMFVPKVFSTINSALADPLATLALRRMAYHVSCQLLLAKQLNANCIDVCASSLLVSQQYQAYVLQRKIKNVHHSIRYKDLKLVYSKFVHILLASTSA